MKGNKSWLKCDAFDETIGPSEVSNEKKRKSRENKAESDINQTKWLRAIATANRAVVRQSFAVRVKAQLHRCMARAR